MNKLNGTLNLFTFSQKIPRLFLSLFLFSLSSSPACSFSFFLVFFIIGIFSNVYYKCEMTYVLQFFLMYNPKLCSSSIFGMYCFLFFVNII